jgi:hypothetical protein
MKGHPSGQHYNISFISLLALPPYVYKRERRATVIRDDELNTQTKGLGLDTLSRSVCNPYYRQPKHGNTTT